MAEADIKNQVPDANVKMEDDEDEEEELLSRTVNEFQDKIQNRSTPYTYLKYNYSLEGAISSEKRIFANLVRALLGCATFVDKLRQTMTEPVATEFRKLINVISFNRRFSPDITKLYNAYTKAIGNNTTENHAYREYGDIIRNLTKIWKTSRFKKIFAISRTIVGYCVICGNYGSPNHSDFGPYILKKYHVYNPDYDLEDGLFAERVREQYKCTTCGMIAEYKIMITTSAPDVITIVPPKNTHKFIPPKSLTLPCEETRTHYYILASYIYVVRKDDVNGVCIVTEHGEKYKTGNSKVTSNVPDIKYYNLLCYAKAGTIDNYSRVLE